MTVTIPQQLEEELCVQATQHGTSVENLVREALVWYLQTDAELLDEWAAWEDVRNEALEIVEGSSSWNMAEYSGLICPTVAERNNGDFVLKGPRRS